MSLHSRETVTEEGRLGSSTSGLAADGKRSFISRTQHLYNISGRNGSHFYI